MISQFLFILLLSVGIYFFVFRVKKVMRNINLGREKVINDRKSERWQTMARVALGQSKMRSRPVAAFFHLLIYIGFVIINIEVLEIMIDGVFGTHRVLSFLGGFYDFLIGSFEYLAIGVLLACVVFLSRRNVIRLKRFHMDEMTSWPKSDANLILIIEIFLMSAFLIMNASDALLQSRGASHYVVAGAFPISSSLFGMLGTYSNETLMMIERGCWWFHIVGIIAFLNYVPYSKHFHILLAFPNTWYANLNPKGQFNNMQSVTNEVKLMMDPAAVPPPADPTGIPQRFGAKDVKDLNWKQLMDAYSCTECGRCTSVCPANITGKLLSPRKIMMDTRDRLEEVGKNLDQKGADYDDGKSLINDYIKDEEIWACTSCNACVEACPILIDPLSIIMDLRRFKVMEESAAPAELNGMFTKMENNGAPWQFSNADRMNWTEN